MSMIDNDWLPAIKEEYSKPYYKELFTFVKDEYSKYVVYPPADDIFNAFHFTPLSKVKVLILGQDPYHNVHQAHGLSFSVLPGEEAPPSYQISIILNKLSNIISNNQVRKKQPQLPCTPPPESTM